MFLLQHRRIDCVALLVEDVPVTSVASLVGNVPAAIVSSPLGDVLSGVTSGGSKLIADVESLASCSQLREEDLNNYRIWLFLSQGILIRFMSWKPTCQLYCFFCFSLLA